MKRWMIYGANGYTGKLIALRAVTMGLTPVIAGRSVDAITTLASELDLQHQVFSLDDPDEVDAQLDSINVVLHCAGPFSATARPMIEACIRQGVHYLDITGEIPVFEYAWHQHDAARKADVVLCPGAGFDVVPTDCLAARLVEALPSATRLILAFRSSGGLSQGTAKTSVEGIARGGYVRKDGDLQNVPLAWKTRQIPFADGQYNAVTIPWGDVFTAWVSTGVGDVEVYLAVPPATSLRMKRMRWLRHLFRIPLVQSIAKSRIERKLVAPDEATRTGTRTQLWGQAFGPDGRSVEATMTVPNGYELTVTASIGLVKHLLDAQSHEGGYFTPSLLAGSDYAEQLPQVSLVLPAS